MRQHSAWLAAGLLVFTVLACNYSASVGGTALHMAKDNNGQPGTETSTFSPSDHTIHCVAKLGDAKDGTKVSFSWYAVEVGERKNEKLKELDYTTKGAENVVHAHLTRPDDWAKGKYKCVATINGADKSVEYTVE